MYVVCTLYLFILSYILLLIYTRIYFPIFEFSFLYLSIWHFQLYRHLHLALPCFMYVPINVRMCESVTPCGCVADCSGKGLEPMVVFVINKTIKQIKNCLLFRN